MQGTHGPYPECSGERNWPTSPNGTNSIGAKNAHPYKQGTNKRGPRCWIKSSPIIPLIGMKCLYQTCQQGGTWCTCSSNRVQFFNTYLQIYIPIYQYWVWKRTLKPDICFQDYLFEMFVTVSKQCRTNWIRNQAQQTLNWQEALIPQ